MDIRLEEFTARDVVFTRRFGAYPQVAPVAWHFLWSWLAEKEQMGSVKRAIGIGWDDPQQTPAADLRYDACVELHARLSVDPGAEISIQTLPGGRYAVATHKGPYHLIGEAIREIRDEKLPEIGAIPDLARPCLEIYLNNPEEVAEADLLTDLCVPVES